MSSESMKPFDIGMPVHPFDLVTQKRKVPAARKSAGTERNDLPEKDENATASRQWSGGYRVKKRRAGC